MKKTFKFDSEWSLAISLLPEERQQLLTEAIKEYQANDTIPDCLDPASMMGFLMVKAVIDRRKRANMRARERRSRRRAKAVLQSSKTSTIKPEGAPSGIDIKAENALPTVSQHAPLAVTRFFQEGTPSTPLHDTVRCIMQDNVFVLRLCNVSGLTRNQAAEAVFKLVNRRIKRRRPVNDLNKEYIENESRLENGKRVLTTNAKFASREMTLEFTIQGATPGDYLIKKKSFFAALYAGAVTISVPADSPDIYHLVYKGNSSTYAVSRNRCFGKVTVKFGQVGHLG